MLSDSTYGDLLSGPEHTEFNFCFLKVVPPNFPKWQLTCHGACASAIIQMERTPLRLAESLILQIAMAKGIYPILRVIMNNFINHTLPSR